MRTKSRSIFQLTLAAGLSGLIAVSVAGKLSGDEAVTDAPAQDGAPADNPPPTTAEARLRAKILHETIHGALQVMHRDFFDEETSLIPSGSLEDVFHELQRSYQIELRWLTVNTDVLNSDHKPQDAFEQKAVEALRAGEEGFEATEDAAYRYAGAIRLSSQCLKCHVKRRTSNRDRVAGLLIKMPVSD